MPKTFAHAYALLIAVNEHRSPGAALPEIAQDVGAIHDILIHPDRCGYAPENVMLIKGPDSTKDGILGGLDWVKEKLDADTSGNATVVIYYTGHGHLEGGEYFLIPFDTNLGHIRRSALRATDFAAEVMALESQRLLVMLDCCHAAGIDVKGLDKIIDVAIPPTLFTGGAAGAQGGKGLNALAKGSGRVILSSSKASEKSWIRKDRKMSIFTWHVIEALIGHAEPKAGAREVLVSDVMGHVHRRVPESARADWNADQHPDSFASGNFPISLLLGGKGLKQGSRAPSPASVAVPTTTGGRSYRAVAREGAAVAQGDKAVAVAAGGTYNYYDGKPPRPGASKEELREAYLRRLSNQANLLPLFTGEGGANPIRLSSIYTALLTQGSDSIGKARPSNSQRKLEGRDTRFSALDALNQESHLVVLGGPGSGKTTFANFVALCMAGEFLADTNSNLKTLTAPIPPDPKVREEKPKQQHWDHGALLPVQIALRDLAAELPRRTATVGADTVWQHIVKRLEEAALGEFAGPLHAELLERGGLILLDGLDEVTDASTRRGLVKQAVQDFQNTFTRCRYLVTSRTYAYTRQDWRLQGFAVAHLQGFSASQIDRFVDVWYAHMAGRTRLTTADAAVRAELLKRAVNSRERIRELAERPLLLTLIARLHTEGGGSLPEKREELYAQAVELLLTQWESLKTRYRPDGKPEIEPGMSEFLKTGRDEIRRELNKLAFEAHRDQPSLVGTADIRQERLVKALLDASREPDIKPKLVEQYLRDRAGILAAHGEEMYQFPHRTFQEYLAACHLTTSHFPDELTRLAKFDPNRWREAVLLAAAKVARGTPESVWSLVEELCLTEPPMPGESPAPANLWGAFMASQALLETGLAEPIASLAERNRTKQSRVRRWARAIVERGWLTPLDRALVGRALSVLGDDRDFDTLIRIRAGTFWMGEEGDSDLQPRHSQSLPYFEISKYLVTNAQYGRFARATARPWHSAESGKPDKHNHPARVVTWHDAIAYCNWLTGEWRTMKKIDSNARVMLPSEAEWEKAARFEDGRNYPWGNIWSEDHANTSEAGLGETSAVGIFPKGRSEFGCLDMVGNVWEWTRSLWGKDLMKPQFGYPYGPTHIKREQLTAKNHILRVLRGGSWDYYPGSARCAYRSRDLPDNRNDDVGFRIAVVFPAPEVSYRWIR